jgi:uncharacterized protein YbaP (TraB family)
MQVPLLHARGQASGLVGLVVALFLGACTNADLRSAAPSLPPATSVTLHLDSAAQIASPPFFRIHGPNGNLIEILGTIHLGPSEGWKIGSTITNALARADSFVLEIDPRSLDEAKLGDVLTSMVMLPAGTTLKDVVSPETAKLIDEHDASLSAIGFPEGARRHKKPWYLVTNIMSLDRQKVGFDPAQSVEAIILSSAGARPLMGLETFEFQLQLLDDLSPEIQDVMLRDTLERRGDTVTEIKKLVEAWKSNDQGALEKIAYQGLDEFPELGAFYDALLKNRNKRWVSTLAQILEDPNRHDHRLFVGVGALHLVGKGSVIDLFQNDGYRVESIHPTCDPLVGRCQTAHP